LTRLPLDGEHHECASAGSRPAATDWVMTELLHYEDFPEGLVIPFGTYHLTREEVIDYARQWDPQPFHLDEEAARKSVLGGLAASGWQSSAILIRLAVEAYANKSAAMASSGVDEARWLKPVHAGETVSGRGTVLSRRVSSKRPEMGILKMKFELLNAAGEVAVEITGVQFMRVRNP
jgi:acyl dehydratase